MSRLGHNHRALAIAAPVNFDVPPFHLKMHSHKEGQVVYVHRGRMVLTLGDAAWAVFAPSLCWIPANVPHYGGAVTSFTGATIWESQLPKLRFPSRPCRLAIPSDAPINKLLSSEREKAYVDLGQLLHSAKAIDFALALPRSQTLHNLALGMIRNPQRMASIERAAACTGMTRRTFTRRFREETSLAFGQWQRLLLSCCAEALFRDGDLVSVLSQRLGYGSVSAFVAMYHRTRGHTLKRLGC